MTAAAFHKIERGLLEALEIAQAGDEEIADRLTREQVAQDAIRARIVAQGRDEMSDYTVEVSLRVHIKLRDDAFTDKFMEEYRENFSPFYNLSEHANHLGWLVASERMDEVTKNSGKEQFIEGYGPIGQFVERAEIVSTDTSVAAGEVA
ncbi:hypothetical protein [Asaia sp. HumB]|uniref:hypothetical protein n=1 Tax=Asaia sp. HumB TaxID=3035475 RepID=UPI0025550088|nr:hypothetical protein [Asaia sp. HumB]MDL2172429.1 hypothetical protein [Asaia sp. HumB]